MAGNPCIDGEESVAAVLVRVPSLVTIDGAKVEEIFLNANDDFGSLFETFCFKTMFFDPKPIHASTFFFIRNQISHEVTPADRQAARDLFRSEMLAAFKDSAGAFETNQFYYFLMKSFQNQGNIIKIIKN